MAEALVIATGLTLLLLLTCTLVHFHALRACNAWLRNLRAGQTRGGPLLAILVAFASHIVQVALFAAAYSVLLRAGLGELRGLTQPSAFSLMYFSTETYSSLGFGDIYPRGELRLLTGIEALVGLVMVAWTASFTYLEMSRHWAADFVRNRNG